MKIAAFGLAAATALLLSACSSGGEDPTTPATPAPTPASTIEAAGPSSSAMPSMGNLDDALCAAAQDNITAAASLQSKTGDLSTMIQDPSFLTSTDTTALNAWGSDMLGLTASTKDFYELAVAQTKGEDINADFVKLDKFVQLYSIALAKSASDAKSNKDFVADVQKLGTDPNLADAAKEAPTSATNVATYLGTRCGLSS